MTALGERVLWFDAADPARLSLRALPPQPPGPADVLYRVEAFALNRSDILYMDSMHYVPTASASRIGYEACGVVEAVGSEVDAFRRGDRVASIPFASSEYGVAGEWAITPARYLTRSPKGLTPEQACASWMQYLTAYYPLMEIAPVRAGDIVLVTAASSSAALGGLQLAKMLGATVIATTRTAAKSPGLLAAGADTVIETDDPDWPTRLKAAAAPSGVRLAYDAVGGDMTSAIVEVMADGGVIFAYGTISGDPVIQLPLLSAVRRDLTLKAYSTPNYSREPDKLARGVGFLLDRIEAGLLRPIIGKVFPFYDALAAYDYLRSAEQFGKVVVRLD